MDIILKFLIRNIREKKLRTILIVISITLSSALFFATMAMSTTMESMYAQRLRQYFGSAELIVHAERRSPSGFLHPLQDDRTPPAAAYVIGVTQTGAEFQSGTKRVNVTLVGIEFGDLARMNPVRMETDEGISPFAGRMIIISRPVADRFGLKAGESLILDIGGTQLRFKIAGISAPAGFLTDDGNNITFITPRETLSSLFNARGRVNTLYAKAISPDRLGELTGAMKALYPRYMVRETVTQQQIRQWTENITIPFRIMLVLVIAISVFIIFTSFQVITTQRLPVIGTFRSIGATRKTTDLVLFGESILYGVAGGLLGCVLGIGALVAMTKLSVSGWMAAVETKITFHAWQLSLTFFLAVGLSFASAAAPVIRVSRIPVKDIILGLHRHESRFTRKRLISGVGCLVCGLVIPFLVPANLALIVDTLCILLTLIGITMLIPVFTRLFVRVLEPVFTFLFGNIGILAAKNIRDNAGILNNIALLSIGISSLFMINTISSSAAVAVSGFYADATHEIEMGTWMMDRSFAQSVQTVEGVEDVCGLYAVFGTVVSGHDTKIQIIHGIRPETFPAFTRIHRGGRPVDLSVLDEGRNIFVTDILAKTLSLRKGDTLTLELARGKEEYTVAGFFSSVMWNGSYALISDRFLKTDGKLSWFNSLHVKVRGNPVEVSERIKEKFVRRRPWVDLVKEMEERNLQSNRQIFLILQGFSLMTLLIGTVGIVNNFIISFIERRRSFALLRSVGMSRVQNRSMIFLEAAACGTAGAVLGVIAGSLMLLIVPQLLMALRLPISVLFSPGTAVSLIIGGIIITVAASLSPALRSSRLNILESLRYE